MNLEIIINLRQKLLFPPSQVRIVNNTVNIARLRKADTSYIHWCGTCLDLRIEGMISLYAIEWLLYQGSTDKKFQRIFDCSIVIFKLNLESRLSITLDFYTLSSS